MASGQAIWADVRRNLEAALKASDLAAARADSLADDDHPLPEDVRFDREIVVGKMVHDCYQAIETAIERMVIAIDQERPVGDRYHFEMLRRAATVVEGLRPAIITKSLEQDLHALRSFHHVVRHAYGDFDYVRAAPNVEIAVRAARSALTEVTAFAQAMGLDVGSSGNSPE
jgi:hypothetical protein